MRDVGNVVWRGSVACHSFIDFHGSKKKTVQLFKKFMYNYFDIYNNLYLRTLLKKIQYLSG